MLIWVSSVVHAQLLYYSNVCVTSDKSTVFTAWHVALSAVLDDRGLGDTVNRHRTHTL